MQRRSRAVLFLSVSVPVEPSSQNLNSSSYTKVLAAIMDSAAPKLGVLFYPL